MVAVSSVVVFFPFKYSFISSILSKSSSILTSNFSASFLVLFFCCTNVYSQVKENKSPLMGYNAHMSDAPSWHQQNFEQTLSKLHPNTLRYPGGSNSFYWDWKNLLGFLATFL